MVTVPAYFDDTRKKAVHLAAAMAGGSIKRLLPEPTAAALAYQMHAKGAERILVFDLGGGTFDLSLLRVSADLYEVEALDGDSQLGGDDIDSAVASWWLENNAVKKEDLAFETWFELLGLAKKAKEAVSREAALATGPPKTGCQREFALPSSGCVLKLVLTSLDLARLVTPIVDSCLARCRSIVAQAGLFASQNRRPHSSWRQHQVAFLEARIN